MRYRMQFMIWVTLLVVISFVLIYVAGGFTNYPARSDLPVTPELLLNLGVTFVGIVASYILVNLVIEKIEQERVKEYIKLNYYPFISNLDKRREVDILDTYTELVQKEEYRDKFFPKIRSVRGSIRIRMLLLNPETYAAIQRHKEVNYNKMPGDLDYIDVLDNCRLTLRLLHEFLNANPELRSKIEVKVYNASPGVALYRSDNSIIASFFPIGALSQYSLQAELAVNSRMGEFMHKRFTDLWMAPSTIPLQRYRFVDLKLIGSDGKEQQANKVRYITLPMLDQDGAAQYYVSGLDLHKAFAKSLHTSYITTFLDGAARYSFEVIFDSHPHHKAIHNLFCTKYGGEHKLLIYKLNRYKPDWSSA